MFPASDGPQTRVEGPGHDLHDWVEFIEDKIELDQCVIEDNLLVLARLEWDGKVIRHASLQALALPGPKGVRTIEGFYLAPPEDRSRYQPQYLRVDFDLNNLGPLLKEPQPHVHIRGAHEPRFPVYGDNVVMDFLDLLYRNYQYDQWLDWVKAVWRDSPKAGVNDPLPTLISAFKDGKSSVVREHANDLRRLRATIREAYTQAWPFTIDPAWRVLFAPP